MRVIPGGRAMRQTAHVTMVRRALTEHERCVLGFLLSADMAGVAALRQQVEAAAVVGRCACGCPSIDLQVAEGSPRSALPNGLFPSEAVASPVSDEPPGNIILFLQDGCLSYLEYVYYSDDVPLAWPAVERLSLVR